MQEGHRISLPLPFGLVPDNCDAESLRGLILACAGCVHRVHMNLICCDYVPKERQPF